MTGTRLYGGVYMVDRPAPENVARMDHNAMRSVVRMRQNGMAIDVGRLNGLAVRLQTEMDDIVGQIEGMTGVRVNPASGPQVAELLFRKLRLGAGKTKKMVKSGERESTRELDIEPYLHEHPCVPLLYDWRERSKLKTTYCVPLVQKARQDRHGNWIVRTEILWTRTGTGRYASKNPNLQNIPTRTKLGTEIRMAFIGRLVNGRRMRLVTVDESQIEMRMAAHVSGARKMIDIFHLPELGADGKPNKMADLHIRTAMSVFKLEAHQVHKLRHRMPMKSAGFGILYLITAMGLMAQLNNPNAQDPAAPHVWTEPETQQLINEWYGEYPEIREMQELDFWRARRYGMVWDIFGRTRLVPEVKSSMPWVVEMGMRAAANVGIQAAAGGTLKIAMARVADEFAEMRRLLRVYVEELMTIHDEVISECEPGMEEGVGGVVGECIERSARLRVPIRWSMGVGERWGELDK